MTRRLDVDGALILSDLDKEERVEVLEEVVQHLCEIRAAWENEFSPQRVELASGAFIIEEMDETELSELNTFLSSYEDNQIWTVSHMEGQQGGSGFSEYIYPIRNLPVHVSGSVIMLGKQTNFNYEADAYYFFTSDKPKLEGLAEYQKLIKVNHPLAPCGLSYTGGCRCEAYEYVWDLGSFSCPFCEEGLDCDHFSDTFSGFQTEWTMENSWDFDTK